MPLVVRSLMPLLLLSSAILAGEQEEAPRTPDPSAIRRHAEALLALGERAPGSQAAGKAADYIESSLRQAGLSEVLRHGTNLLTPVDRGCRLKVAEREIVLKPFVANGLALPTTGGQAVVGKILYLGDQTDSLGSEANLDRAIVILDGRLAKRWTVCAELGARAVVFSNPEAMASQEVSQGYADASVDLPRFTCDLPAGALAALNGAQAELTAEVVLQPQTAVTLVARIRGTNATPRPDALILSSGYEAGGVVAGHDPAATRAWNAGLLLELAAQFQARPTRNDVLVIFHGARAEHFRGLRQVLAGLTDPFERGKVTDAKLQITESMGRNATQVELLRIYYDLWRGLSIKGSFQEFLAGTVKDETTLLRLLGRCDDHGKVTLPFLPEQTLDPAFAATAPPFLGLELTPAERGLVRSLFGTRPADATRLAAEASVPAQGSGRLVWWRYALAGLTVLVGLTALLARIKFRRPHWGLVVVILTLALIGARLLLIRPDRGGPVTTDVVSESEALIEQGFQTAASEAGRRLEAVSRQLECGRVVRSLSAKQERTARDEGNIARCQYQYRLATGRPLPGPGAALEALVNGLDEEFGAWRDLQQRLSNRKPLSLKEQERLVRILTDLTEPVEGRQPGLVRHREILVGRFRELLSSFGIQQALSGVKPRLFIDLDFTDGHNQFSSVSKGLFFSDDNSLLLHRQVRRLIETFSDPEWAYSKDPYDGDEKPTAFWPPDFVHAAGASAYLLRGMTLATTLDLRVRLGSPQDTAAAFQSANFLQQTRSLTRLLRFMADDRYLLEVKFDPSPICQPSPVVRVRTASEGSASGKKAFAYPIIQVCEHLGRRFLGDVRPVQTLAGDGWGEVPLFHTPKNVGVKDSGLIRPYALDEQGRLTQVAVSQALNKQAATLARLDYKKPTDLDVSVFRPDAACLFRIMEPRLLKHLSSKSQAVIQLLAASSDASPRYGHIEYDSIRGAAAIFSDPGTRIRVLGRETKVGNQFLLLGHYDQKTGSFDGLDPRGSLSVEPAQPDSALRFVPTSLAGARDIWQLDRQRLERLRRNGLSPEAVWETHARTQPYLEQADRCLAAGDLAGVDGAALAAQAIENHVYPAILSTAKDVVYGLVVLLLLCIPFAAVCERLFLASTTIYGRVGGFLGFFAATFLFFYFLHPAFAIAQTPIIIFLAFTIIVMSLLVIWLLSKRFELEMEHIRLSGLGLHKADVTRFGTLLATGTLGISNMRRRPLRTFLTGITVVLMTFILLTFASFNAKPGLFTQQLEASPSRAGLQIRQPGWGQFTNEAVDRVTSSWGRQMRVHVVRWVLPDANRDQRRLWVTGTQEGLRDSLRGLIGSSDADPSGLARSLIRYDGDGRELPERGYQGQADWIFLPRRVIEHCRLALGRPIRFQGLELRVGMVDREALLAATHLDGESPTPLEIDPATMEERRLEMQRSIEASLQGGEVGMRAGDVASTSWIHLDPDVVGVVSEGTAARLGGGVVAIDLVPWTRAEAAADPRLVAGENLDLETFSDAIAQQIFYPIIVSRGGTCMVKTSVGTLSMSGLTEVIIPLILGGLIIFSTMLGSVAERGREIFIYASLGLAPLHIAVLFLVEAAIYALLGGIGGYILAQVLVKALSVLSGFGWLATPDINYSSFTAVATILLVMATVLISAIYPALVASRAARPGESTDFSVPQPQGDQLEIPFPFTVARRDILGLLAFIKAYCDMNSEASVGAFTAAEATLRRQEPDFQVEARTWLAPFDLGISQRFVLAAHPTDMKAIYKVHISLTLLSGQRGPWRRMVLPFLQELRKQFLVWRTLDRHTMDRYRALGGDLEAAKRVEQHQTELAALELAAQEQKHSEDQALRDAFAAKAGDAQAAARLAAKPAPAGRKEEG